MPMRLATDRRRHLRPAYLIDRVRWGPGPSTHHRVTGHASTDRTTQWWSTGRGSVVALLIDPSGHGRKPPCPPKRRGDWMTGCRASACPPASPANLANTTTPTLINNHRDYAAAPARARERIRAPTNRSNNDLTVPTPAWMTQRGAYLFGWVPHPAESSVRVVWCARADGTGAGMSADGVAAGTTASPPSRCHPPGHADRSGRVGPAGLQVPAIEGTAPVSGEAVGERHSGLGDDDAATAEQARRRYWRQRAWSSRVLHRLGQLTSHAGAGLVAGGVIIGWLIVGVAIDFPGWWETRSTSPVRLSP